MSDTSSPLTVMSSPLSELSEPPGSPGPFVLPPSVLSEAPEVDLAAENLEEIGGIEVQRAEDRSESAPSVQAIQEVEPESNRHDHPPISENLADETEDEITILEGQSTLHSEAADHNQEPNRTQNGNVVEVRWAGTGADDDLIIEVDENGYEIPKSDEVVAQELQDEANEEEADDDLWDDGEKGARSLLDHCRGSKHKFLQEMRSCVLNIWYGLVVMRCASRYDDIGDLQYQQHPLFFNTMSAKQLEEIEGNSPVSIARILLPCYRY
jgi:hypothetical protein